MNKDEYQSLSSFIDLLIDAVCVVDKTGRFEFVSASAERIFGYRSEEMIGMKVLDLVFPADRKRTLAAAISIMQGNENTHFENRYVRKDGQVVDILWSARWSDKHQQRIAIARDISSRKNIERRQAALYAISEATHLAEDLLTLYQGIHNIIAQLLPATNFAIASYEPKTNQLSFLYKTHGNPIGSLNDNALTPRRGKTQNSNLISHSNTAQNHDEQDEIIFCHHVIHSAKPVLIKLNSMEKYPEEIRQILTNSQSSWLGLPLKQQHDIIGVLIMHSDVCDPEYTIQDQELMGFVSTQIATAIERKQMLTRLKHLALYDQLTQLPNRALFDDRIKNALTHAKRGGHSISLLFLDLDKFKAVNDTCGHQIGDALLQMTAQRILHCVRETDTVSRFGGDEFVILLDDAGSRDNILKIAQAILNALNMPFQLAGQSLHIVPSIGIALYPQHGMDEKQLLASSDSAMYQAKSKGGNRIEVSS
ncbi:GGDEF domain-containing protein [Shewanella sp. SR44-3]|uniref:GGDEF domain-containing protein n=1 Tax=Shewanella sp. SR44-3 TaxID=2760936 RepID=UPI0015FE7AF4|nr:GGDEF domain-containing protein [Shewanella sp. SR44-3]MBB1269322.1 diguanylate cyclase [Shewanella sp. SR44-3]